MNVLEIKAAVRARDGHRCVQCGTTNEEHLARTGRQLEVHRVTPGSAYSVEPGVCQTLCRKCHGPKPRRRRGSLPYATVRIPGDLWRKIRIVAAYAGIRPTQYLDRVLREVVGREFAAVLKEIAAKYGVTPEDE